MIDDIDPKVYLEAFIVEHTCERCGRSDHEVGPLMVGWHCCEAKQHGYTLKHWKNWRACVGCLSSPGLLGFEKWISPIIAGFVRNGGQGLADTLRDILVVQPLPMPNAEVFYLDYVVRVGPDEVLPQNTVARIGHDMADAVAHAMGVAEAVGR